jgi:hypothetical protein
LVATDQIGSSIERLLDPLTRAEARKKVVQYMSSNQGATITVMDKLHEIVLSTAQNHK